MSNSFDLVLSKTASHEAIRLALVSSIPGDRLNIQASVEHLTFDSKVLSASVGTTDDPLWPCAISVWNSPSDLGLGEHPELRIAIELCRALNCNALSLGDIQPFVEGIDPYDPYYCLALVDGNWYLASTVNSPLMGPYTDETTTFPGDATVRLLDRIHIPPNIAAPTP